MISWNANSKKNEVLLSPLVSFSRLQIKEDSPGAIKVMSRLLKNVTYPVLRWMLFAGRWYRVPSTTNAAAARLINENIIFICSSYVISGRLSFSVISRKSVYASAEKRDDNARCLLANEAGVACLLAISEKIKMRWRTCVAAKR